MKRKYFNELPGLFFVRKTQTQVKTFDCRIDCSSWSRNEDVLIYYVKAIDFERHGSAAWQVPMLQVGRGKISLAQFEEIIQAKDSSKAICCTE
jgi:tRNA pseudouridine38-40 synthase